MRKIGKRRLILILLIIIIIMVRFIPHLGEIYSLYFYPYLSASLSWLVSWIPFSFDECVVVILLLGLIVYTFCARRKFLKANQKTNIWKHIVSVEIETSGWIFVWFYLGWGMNYYRDSFFVRADVEKVEMNKADFDSFLKEYTDSLNASYVDIHDINEDSVMSEIKSVYVKISSNYGLCQPKSYQKPKTLSFNWIYSSVGVLGYMGPFADESHINNKLLPWQFASVYAHETAHLLSVSSEAEANFWAYKVCTNSRCKAIRYSGYCGILPNMIHNARNMLTDREFKVWISTIDKRIIAQREYQTAYWRAQLCPLLSSLQDVMFDALLKGNRIPSGVKNYDQVLEMILSTRGKDIF